MTTRTTIVGIIIFLLIIQIGIVCVYMRNKPFTSMTNLANPANSKHGTVDSDNNKAKLRLESSRVLLDSSRPNTSNSLSLVKVLPKNTSRHLTNKSMLASVQEQHSLDSNSVLSTTKRLIDEPKHVTIQPSSVAKTGSTAVAKSNLTVELPCEDIFQDLFQPQSPVCNLVTKTWKNGSFCHDLFENTFQLQAPVCSNPKSSILKSSVECFGNPHSRSMATCTLRNVVVSPHILRNAMSDPDQPNFASKDCLVALLEGAGTECASMTLTSLYSRVEGGDYVLKMVKRLSEEKLKNPSICDVWINETVLFFTAHRFHIYFRFLDYYNVHKILQDMKHRITSNSRIIRISGSDGYKFPEFDQALFPELKIQTLEDLQDVKTCFKNIVLVPKSYASPMFQCKNRVVLRKKCMDCNGQGLHGTDIYSFRKRVITSCSKSGQLHRKNSSLIVLVSRTPYLRNTNDNIAKFERILDNELELTREIQKAFSNSAVQVVHLEKLSLCEQVAYGYNADIYLGVHGSGLVHLWWMRDNALVYEMEPHYEVGNPTFRMLSRISGRNYHSEHIGGGWKTVHSNVKSIIQNLKKYSKLL